MKTLTRIGIAAVLAVAPCTTLAYKACDSAEAGIALWNDHMPRRKALAEKKFAEVDRYLGDLLAANAAGKANDAELNFIFEAVTVGGAANEPLYAEWAKAFPKSEAARLAYAYNLVWQGWKARGAEYAGKTTRSQFEAMGQAFKRAMAALDDAEKLSQRPTLEWAKRIEILRAMGGDEIPAIYDKAIKKYPTTVFVRSEYIEASAIRWGGSPDRLARAGEDAKSLPEADRRYVQGLVEHEFGMLYAHLQKDPKKAAQHFEKAMAACEGFSQSSAQAMTLYGAERDFPRLIAASNHYIRRKPGDGWGYRYRGWAYEASGKLPEAFKDFQRATQAGDADSFARLAQFYEHGSGGAPRDFQKAIDLYMIAHEKGIAGAQEKAEKVRKIAGASLKGAK